MNVADSVAKDRAISGVELTESSLFPPITARLAIAVGIALVAFSLALMRFRGAPYEYAGDYTWHWRAGRAMLDGLSPYKVINATPYYPYNSGYYYLLPTAVVAIPFALLAPHIALATWAGLSLGLLGFALTRDGYWRLPILASLPALWTVFSGQVACFTTAVILLPALWWLWPFKYTLGAAGAAYQLSMRYVAAGAALVALSILIWPWWPRDWVAELSDRIGVFYHVPLSVPGGVLLLLVLLRWRRPEARLVAVMACVPQTMLFYDQLPLALAANSFRQALWFSLASYAAPFVSNTIYGSTPIDPRPLVARNSPVIVACYYLPVVLLVLLRPNVGRVPVWLERVSGVLPAWMRGSAT